RQGPVLALGVLQLPIGRGDLVKPALSADPVDPPQSGGHHGGGVPFLGGERGQRRLRVLEELGRGVGQRLLQSVASGSCRLLRDLEDRGGLLHRRGELGVGGGLAGGGQRGLGLVGRARRVRRERGPGRELGAV